MTSGRDPGLRRRQGSACRITRLVEQLQQLHRRYLFGWVPSKEGEHDLGGGQWGGTLVVHEVYQRLDHSLGVQIPASVRAAFSPANPVTSEPRELSAADGQASVVLADLPGDHPCLVTVRVTADARSFAIRLFENDRGEAYAYRVRQGERRIDFDKIPNYPWFRYDNRGLERPLAAEPGRAYDIEILIDDTIATCYVDGVALGARMYDKPGGQVAIGVVDGSLTLHRVEVRLDHLQAAIVRQGAYQFRTQPVAGVPVHDQPGRSRHRHLVPAAN